MNDAIALAAKMWPTVPRKNLEANVPHIVAGLERFGINDPDMQRVAFATVGVEVGPFIPIGEYISKYNTWPGGEPFGRYDNRTNLGNGQPGDGARFKGRGFVQLTGRANYRDIGKVVGADLEGNPEAANDPATAGLILAAFLKRCETAMRAALHRHDLPAARKLVNGGSHGLPEFIAAFNR